MIYEEILHEMQAEFERLTGMEADSASDIGIRLKLLAGQLAGVEIKADYLLRQSLPQTADGKYLDMHAELRGLSRRGDACALGELTFARAMQGNEETVIPSGVVCSTGPALDIRFVTLSEAVIPPRGLAVSVPAAALCGGKSGNVAAGAVSVMITPPQGIETVTNEAPFRGGEDAETDASLRARLLESCRQISNGANRAYYRGVAMNNPDVKKAAALAGSGGGSVEIVVQLREGVDSEPLLQSLLADFEDKREIGVNVSVRRAGEVGVPVRVQASLHPGYDRQETQARISNAVREYGESLEIGEEITLAALGNRIFSEAGVKNYKIISPAADVTVGGDEIGIVSLSEFTQLA